ncbi:helix-hairpin-helix motif protein [bacterium BMS3Abin04]|nr:helix-hairpin-helix motif protein [bacterium BMS3Abin04]
MKLLFATILFLYPFIKILSQQDSSNQINNLIEAFTENQTEGVESSQLYSLFEYLLDNPINVNTASISELNTIPFLDYSTAEKIVLIRNKIGHYTSLSQLDSIPGIDKKNIYAAKHFLILSDKFSQSPKSRNRYFQSRFRTRIINDLQEKKGFLNGNYLGTKPKTYLRLLLDYSNNYKAGIVLDKDAGERSYADFISAHLSFKDFGILNKLILGDYLVEFGQGLALWSPYSFSKSSEAVRTVIKSPRNLIEYTSVDENQFMRGISGKLELNNFSLTSFYSKHKIDANVDSLNDLILSFSKDGYHRTLNEIQKHNTVDETVWGGILSYEPETGIALGLLYYQTNFSLPAFPKNHNSLSGNKFNFLSFSYSAYWGNIILNGEAAYNNLSVASITNLFIRINNNLKIIFSFRNYPHNYYNLNSAGFSERSGTKNELGFYTGLAWKTNLGVFNIYFDQFKFPRETNSVPFSSSGNEFMLDFLSGKFRKAQLHLRYKREKKDKLISEVDKIYPNVSNSIRSEISVNVSHKLRLRTRFEFRINQMNDSSEKGFLVFQDINWVLFKDTNIKGRIIFFKTDSYNSRIYEFENDLRGILFNPALYGNGMRWYLIAQYRLSNLFNMSLKYSETYKPSTLSLGSGNNEIFGGLDNKISLQIDAQL